MQHPPSEATSQQTFLEDLNRQVGGGHPVTAAHHAGGYTAVLKLARERLDELNREYVTLIAGHELRWFTNRELEERRRTWTPEKARLNEQIGELDSQIRGWEFVAGQVAGYAANEALGWTILPDLTCAKVLDNGKVVSTYGWVSQWHEGGERYSYDGPDEPWKRRHQRHGRAFGDRVRAERIERAKTKPLMMSTARRSRERRPRATRRTASSSSTSSADPPDSDGELSRRRELRHVAYALTAFLRTIGGAR